jgi:hypothetical protein
MGRLKKRILPKDVIINIGEKAPIPPCPIPGHKWGEVQHLATTSLGVAWALSSLASVFCLFSRVGLRGGDADWDGRSSTTKR